MKKVFLLFLAIIGLVTSCQLEPFPETEETPENPSNIEEKTDMFIETENEFIFETNDTSYLNKKGYTFWCFRNENIGDILQPIETTLYKSSGSLGGGYGIVFAQQKLGEQDFLITVMINNYGQYIIGKVIDGNFMEIVEWTTTKSLITGSNVANKIRITQKDNCFYLELNGIEVNYFTVSENINLDKSRNGYVAVLLGNENFPKDKVRVVYKK